MHILDKIFKRKKSGSTTSTLSQTSTKVESPVVRIPRSNSKKRLSTVSVVDGESIVDFASNDDTFHEDTVDEGEESEQVSAFSLDFDAGQPFAGLDNRVLQVPKYFKTSKRHKNAPKALKNLFLAQELTMGEEGEESSSDNESVDSLDEDARKKNGRHEIFIMEFSRDGKYLAAAGRDSVIKVWKVISSPLSRLEGEKEGDEREESSKRHRDPIYDAPVFQRKPCMVFRGHTASVISLDWSKNNFLISGSMDRTARLWHVEREQCLQTFSHEDFVTAVRFHPTDDRFFFSGSLDNHVRLWSILEQSVSYVQDLGERVLVTALGVTPDGEFCIAGGFNGSVIILETKGLYVRRRFDISKVSFHNTSGNRITGIRVYETVPEEGDALSRWAVLITTNDSKIRLVSSNSRKLVTRFRGLTNESASIQASITEDHQYIISGSEDHYCYVWENNNGIINNRIRSALKELLEGREKNEKDKKDDDSKKHFSLHHHRYARIMRHLMEHGHAEYVSNENTSYSSFHAHHSKVNVALFAPEQTKRLLELSDDPVFDLANRGRKLKFHDPDASAGHVIVTTDQYGLIRVFRQDTAAVVRAHLISLCRRRRNESSDDCPLSKVTSKKIEIPGKKIEIPIMKLKKARSRNEKRNEKKNRLSCGSAPASPSSAMFTFEGVNVTREYSDDDRPFVKPNVGGEKRDVPRIITSQLPSPGREGGDVEGFETPVVSVRDLRVERMKKHANEHELER